MLSKVDQDEAVLFLGKLTKLISVELIVGKDNRPAKVDVYNLSRDAYEEMLGMRKEALSKFCFTSEDVMLDFLFTKKDCLCGADLIFSLTMRDSGIYVRTTELNGRGGSMSYVRKLKYHKHNFVLNKDAHDLRLIVTQIDPEI